MKLRGNLALVTGASRGIGRAIAENLVQNGCRVVITGRNAQTLAQTAAEIGAIPRVHDAADWGGAAETVEWAAAQLGGLDMVVNNAGLFAQRSEWNRDELLRTTADEWRRVMDVNVSGLFFMMQAAVRHMKSHGVRGNVLNVTSVAGAEPIYGAYGASKIAATGLTRGWGRMFAPDGIVINGIAPGPVATEMNHWHPGDSMAHSRIPFGRYASAEEVAQCVLYLLSPAAEMICGETVILDGAYAVR